MAFGEAGSLTTNSATENEPITVTLTEPLTDPVIALTGTTNGGDPYTLRVISETYDANGDTTSFTFIIEEWEYLDGAHPVDETISWLAVEEGVHTLPDGRLIEAGFSSVNHSKTTTEFDAEFDTAPVVLTTVMSNNDTTTVDSDAVSVSAAEFKMRLQEEEAEDGRHAYETVGWIAIEPGGDAGSGLATVQNDVDHDASTITFDEEFNDAVVLADSQSVRGNNTATVSISSSDNASVDVFIREEQSQDSEVFHKEEAVGVVAFEAGLIPCFAGDARIATPSGEACARNLKAGDIVKVGNGRTAPIRLVMQRALSDADLQKWPKLRPVVISRGALGQGLPVADLRVSPQHRILINSPIAQRMFGTPEVLIAAIKLTMLPGVYIDQNATGVTYVHILFDDHQIVYAEGAPTESLLSGPFTLQTLPPESREELLLLFPEMGRPDYVAEPARTIPCARTQKRLVQRLAKNRKLPLDPRLTRARPKDLSA
jgi:hypothetical protein